VVDPFCVTLDRLTVCINLLCNYDTVILSYRGLSRVGVTIRPASAMSAIVARARRRPVRIGCIVLWLPARAFLVAGPSCRLSRKIREVMCKDK
jgi:hypothetical protein